MSTIITRVGKGSPLTFDELDANFTNLNTDKYQAGNNVSLGTISASTVTSSALTSGRITFASTSGLLIDNANLTWDNTNNQLGIGTSSPTAKLEVYSNIATSFSKVTGDGFGATFLAQRYDNTSTGPFLILNKFRGSVASPITVNTGDSAGTISYQAYAGTNSRTISTIASFVETYISDTDISGYITFNTRPTGTSAVNTERMRITSAGDVGIGNSAPACKLQVTSGCIAGGYATAANIVTTANFSQLGNVIQKSINASQTIDANVPPAGTICVLQIIKSSSTNSVITFSTGFISAGTLSTGTDITKRFNLIYASNGTNLVEISRNGPI